MENNYTDNHISIYENNIYIITIYKNIECIPKLGLLSKIIDFGNCEIKIKNNLGLKDYNLIRISIELKSGKEAYQINNNSYELYHPFTGKLINYEEKCNNEKIFTQNNITNIINNSRVNLDYINQMYKANINLFDPSNPFYTDLCIHYPDILQKDVPLKKRALAYYPDIELCEDDDCTLYEVFLNNLTSKCECVIKSGKNNGNENKIKNNPLYQNEIGQFEEFFYKTNINVMKCYKDVFQYKYFIKNVGGFIIIRFILIKIFCTVWYYTRSKSNIKKYFVILTQSFIKYLSEKKLGNDLNIDDNTDKQNFPPPKSKKNKDKVNKDNNRDENKNYKIKSKRSKNKIKSNNINLQNNIAIYGSSNEEKINNFSNLELNSKKFKSNNKLSFDFDDLKKRNTLINDNSPQSIKNDLDINIQEYIKTEPDDMEYDDAIRKDDRKFCSFLLERIKTKQIILNAFF